MPPRKYTDSNQREITQEWLDWDDQLTEDVIMGFGSSSHEAYYPEQYDKALPEGGGWIRVLSEPSTELRARFRVPVLSMWRATSAPMNGGGVRGKRPILARIVTPGGDLHLYPHEYVLVPEIGPYIGMDPDVTMHRMSGEPLLDEDAEQRVFYLQSRGITRQDAVLMLLDSIETDGFCYFTMAPEYVEMFGGVGQPLWQHIAENPRG